MPRGRLAERFVRGTLRLGPEERQRARADGRHRHARARCCASAATTWRSRASGTSRSRVGGDGWSAADSERIERDYGFAEWEPPDAGGDAKAATFGGGNAGTTHEGWDEDYTRQMERWLGRADLPEPFCLVFSLVNPHDVLGYPSSFEEGGYSAADFRGLGVPLPATIDEDLRDKPTVHSLMKLGQTAYIGGLDDRAAQQDYVNFYAHLHRVVDEKIGRLLARARRPGRPGLAALAHGDRADLRPRRARACRTAGCGRRCSTPTRSRSGCRS